MSLNQILQNIDITKIISPTGQTYGQELVNAANTLSSCIQSRINRGTMGNVLTTADIASVRVSGNKLTVTITVQNSLRPSIFKTYTGKDANVFWLLNDGFTVKKNVWFKNIPNFGYRVAENFVEGGIADFNSKNPLGIKVTVKRPLLYYG